MSETKIGKRDQMYLDRLTKLGVSQAELERVRAGFIADQLAREQKALEGNDFLKRQAERREADKANPIAVLNLPAREAGTVTYKNGKTKKVSKRNAATLIKVCPIGSNGKMTSVLMTGSQAQWLVDNIDKVKSLISQVPAV